MPFCKGKQERGEIHAPGAKRRKRDTYHVQPVIEIKPKEAVPHQWFERAIGGGDHSNVDRRLAIRTNRTKNAALKNVKQFGLKS